MMINSIVKNNYKSFYTILYIMKELRLVQQKGAVRDVTMRLVEVDHGMGSILKAIDSSVANRRS